MTTTTSYGNWNNRVDSANTTVESTIAAVAAGGGGDWCERMEQQGAFDRIAIQYREAINLALPDGITIAGDEFYGPYYRDTEADGIDIAEGIEGIDLMAIIEAHDCDR
jgi:hypothetical protein